MVNALAFWGDDAASRFDRILQVCTAAVAVVYGLAVARKVRGSERVWRLLGVGAVACLTLGEIAWWNRGSGVPPLTWVVLYWLFLSLATASVVVLAVAHDSPVRLA